jgi:hypothetical protein
MARLPFPFSIRACGFPAHGLPMIFLVVTTQRPGTQTDHAVAYKKTTRGA